MKWYIWYLILFGLVMLIAGITDYADSPELACIWGYVISSIGMFCLGIRLERGHW